MKEKLTIEEYEKIKQLVDCALDASNKKDAQKYINQMQSYEYNLCGNARNILGELICCVKNASGRVADKERKIYFVRSKLYVLECHGVENK